MIKLKDLLKESYAWERKFGESLPTLADVQKKHLSERVSSSLVNKMIKAINKGKDVVV